MRFQRASSLLWALCVSLSAVSGLQAQNLLVSDAHEPSVTFPFPGAAAVLPVPPLAIRGSHAGLTLLDRTLLGAAAGLRYLDYQTTVKALSDPTDFHEVELPQALVDNHAALAAFEAGTVVVNYWIYRQLVRHGHRRLARAGQIINLGAVGGTVAFNEYSLAKYYPHRVQR